MEEKVRFELTVRFRTTVFKTVALILSATSPWSQRMESNHFRHGYVFHVVLLCNIGCGGKSRTCTRRAYETRVSAIWTTPLRNCVCRPQDNIYKEKGVYYHETLVIQKGRQTKQKTWGVSRITLLRDFSYLGGLSCLRTICIRVYRGGKV